MKIFKHRNLLGFLFGIIALIPIISIGVKCAYVSVNKNAYQSYSDYMYQHNVLVESTNNLIVNTNYVYTYADTQTQTARTINFNSLSFDPLDYGFSEHNYTHFFTLNNFLYLYYDNIIDNDHRDIQGVWGTSLTSFTFNLKTIPTFTGNLSTGNANIYSIQYLQGTLDNVFEYAISEITGNSNLGKLNFITWFADLFLDLDNATNMLYVGFVNWYFNYVLLVSLAFILFAVLMWFVNFIRRLLEKGQDFGQGGY